MRRFLKLLLPLLVLAGPVARADQSSPLDEVVDSSSPIKTRLKMEGLSDNEKAFLKGLGKAGKQLKEFRELIDYTQAALDAAQKGEQAPISPKSSVKPLLEEIRAMKAAVAEIEMPDGATMGPTPQLGDGAASRRAALHDSVEQFISLQARLLQLEQIRDQLADFSHDVNAASDAARVLSLAILKGLDEHRELFAPLAEQLGFLALDASTLEVELNGLASDATAKAKAFGAEVAVRAVRAENFRTNLAQLLSAERAALMADRQKLAERQEAVEKEQAGLEVEAKQLEAEQKSLEAEAAGAEAEARAIEATRQGLEAAIRALNNDVAALNQLTSEINAMVYRDCPNGESFDRCSHDDLKRAFVNRRNAKIADYNQRKANIESRGASLTQQQSQLNTRISQFNARAGRFQRFKSRAEAFLTRRDKLAADAKAFVKDVVENAANLDANGDDQDALSGALGEDRVDELDEG